MMSNEQSRERCLEVLGLAPEAAAHEIKAAYRDLAKVWHPDRFTHDPRLQQKAQEKLKEINDAYQQLLTARYSPRSRHATRGNNATRHADTTRDTNARRDRDATRDARRAPDDDGATRSARHDDKAARSARHDDDATRSARRDARHATREHAPPHARRRIGWLVFVPVLAFCATFAFVTPRMLRSRVASPSPDSSVAVASSREQQADEARQTTDDDNAGQKNRVKQKLTDPASHADSSSTTDAAVDKIAEATATPLRALPTVSVAIDPATGLRARPDCPNKLIVTYPTGAEPRAYCHAEHRRSESNVAATEDKTEATEDKRAGKSRLKSLAGRLASPSKWLSDKSSSDDASKKSAARDQSRVQN